MSNLHPAKAAKARAQLIAAIAQYDGAPTDLAFLTVVKAFEVCMEYVWRELKRRIESDGLESASPKMAIKQAARIGIITDPEAWLQCLNARNNSVHDYFGISTDDYLALARRLVTLMATLPE